MKYNESTYRCVQLDQGLKYPTMPQFICVDTDEGAYWSERRTVLNRNFADAMLDVAWPGCHVFALKGDSWKDSWQYRGRMTVLPLFEGHASLTVRVVFPRNDKGEWELLTHMDFEWTPSYQPPGILRHRETQAMWSLGDGDIVIGKTDVGRKMKPFDLYLTIDYDEDVPETLDDYMKLRKGAIKRNRGWL